MHPTSADPATDRRHIRRSRLRARAAGVLLAVATTLVPALATAALGERAESIAADGTALKAKRSAEFRRRNYHLVELTSPATTVREFVGADGKVFAVAWSGRVHPELEPLLGAYAAEYREAASAAPRQRGARRGRVETEHLIVETWGHMRSLHGRAYVKALVPRGVARDEIR